MEKLKKIINYNTYRINISEDINELNITKKQKQRIEEISSDILFKLKKMKYNRIDYFVMGNKKHIIIDVLMTTRTKIISFAVEFKEKEENIKYTLISDKNTEFQEKINFKEQNKIYKRFLTSKNVFIILLEKSVFEEKIVNEVTYFMVKELKNNFEITNLYSGEKIKLSKTLKNEMLNEIILLQMI